MIRCPIRVPAWDKMRVMATSPPILAAAASRMVA